MSEVSARKHVLLERRPALDLLSQEPADAPEDRTGARLLQKGAKVAAEHLADALADDLQRQAIAPEASNQIGPLLRRARELLVGQQDLPFGDPETAELDRADCATAEQGELGRRLAAGHHETALMASFADSLQEPAVAGVAVSVASLALTWLGAASVVLPMPPVPSTAASRQRSSSTQLRRVASSAVAATMLGAAARTVLRRLRF